MARLSSANVKLVFFLLTVLFPVTLAKVQFIDTSRYDTVYACEGKPLKLECKDGEIIHLDRAIYGRYSITVCNDHGNTDWSVNCMSTNTLPLLQARCNEKRNCSIQANTSLFSDPCPGTMKYLEAQYHCVPASLSTTTLRPNPPWLITSQPSVWNADKLLTLKPATPIPPILSSPQLDDIVGSSVDEEPVSVSVTTTSTSTTATPEVSIVVNNYKENNSKTDNEHLQSTGAITTEWIVPTSDLPPQLSIIDVEGMDDRLSLSCAPETSRSLFWNWTKSGEEAVQPCPGGAAGLARWRCQTYIKGVTFRSPPTPDLSECRSVWLSSLEGRLHQGDSIISIANDLSQVTDSKPLYGGDMMTTTKMLRDVAQKMEKDMVTFPDKQQQEAMVTDLLQCVVRIGSNLLNASQYPSWKDLTFSEQMRVATSLLIGLEENSFLLADIMMKEKTITHSVQNILLSVRVIATQNVDTEVFPHSYSSNTGFFMNNTWLQLHRTALLENSEAGFIRLVYIAFDSLENILQPQSSNGLRIINSKIISASLGKGKHIQLHQPVKLCFQHLQIDNVSNPTCVFWDYTENGWSEEGCSVIYSNQTHTLCKCNHLTNFAILMDLKNSGSEPLSIATNNMVMYISCIFSGICFLLAAITLQLTVKSNRTVILKNVFFCLFLVECFFMFGITQENIVFICTIMAAILHILLLCSFTWTLIEGFHLYATLIEAFDSEKLQMRLYYLVGYGVPLTVVIVACYMDNTYIYNTNNSFCLQANTIIIYSIMFVVSVNLVFLCLSLYIIKSNSSMMSVKCKENVKITSLKMWLKSAILLFVFITSTWTLAFLYIASYSTFMLYIFSAVNCSQGLLIIILYCIKNNSVYKVFSELTIISFLPWQCCLINSTPELNLNYKNQRTSLYGTSVGQNSQGSIAESSTPRSLSSHRMNTFHQPHERHAVTKVVDIQNEIDLPNLDNSICNEDPKSGICGATLPYSRSCQKSYSRTKLPKNSAVFSSGTLHKQSSQSKPNIQDNCFTLNKPTYVHSSRGAPNICSLRCNTIGDGFVDNNCSSKKYIGVSGVRATSPWNHTYSEIMGGISASAGLDDPVYEEIEREREREREQAALVSDLSDEDGRRNSDMSRQSSKSYGDHRPLIMAPTQNPETHNFHTALNAAFRQQLKEQTARTIAVLDGQTVVCHLQPEQNDVFNSQTIQHYSYEC
ncbi:latrophilin Cirl isoform X1 [Acyrthosiphon pisum]|uniref:Latrophilin Cirl n=1 Tax=Acyrthosiphon pisum TaxID=7029 RepID=A0A8R2NUP9_ACYPI|nr:latrophilin Cirl isoform X1 [Acyrthosiphon pisum]